ncbi:Zinc finger BED domain containing protein 1 [Dissostichus eleginoides]|uniref:Zinc finger BED domain containing protein 1 n=1 Tax=Dissostichus eleginoides TaxID=100907 RepID=A0AAD9F1N9_DISEL|nr:Zinc finger BED domain containing protein 1 [Dissostichus eleginoides]
MNYHLKHAHPLYVDRATPSTSTSSSQPPLKLSQTTLVLKPPLSDKRKRDITDKIADFVALDMRPVNIVEGEGFKPGYTVPKRDTTKVLEVSHTAANIAERLGEVMEEFGIPPEKRVAVVHDNAANMVLCAQQLSQNPSWGNVQGIRCAGHTLQLCINAAVKLDPICRVIAAARRLVGHFKKSAKATSALTLKQKQQNVAEHKLIQDVSTRWNSTYSMLERLLEQRCPVTAVLSEPGTTHRSDRDLDLTTAQWRIAEDIVSVLRPMINLTELLSQDVNASLSATLPMLVNMKRRHLLSRDDDSTTVKAVKKKITEENDKRWELTGKKRDDAYATVSDLAESLSPAEEATAQREDSSGAEESEPAPKRQREKQQDISMLMAFDEDQETEDHKKEMTTYLEDRTKVDKGPLICGN